MPQNQCPMLLRSMLLVNGFNDIDDDDSLQSSKDILEIVKTCLKAVKKLKTGHTIKMMTHLVAIAEYVKL